MVHENPAAKLSAIKVTDEDYEVDPFTQAEYKKILATIPSCQYGPLFFLCIALFDLEGQPSVDPSAPHQMRLYLKSSS